MWTWLKTPTRLVPLVFLLVILSGAFLLSLPIARAGQGGAPLLTALFVATSAVGVTGLSTVDTAVYWSGFGQVVIYLLFHIGGFGIMSVSTLLGMTVSRRLGLGRQLIVQAETRGIAPGDVVSVLRFVIGLAIVVEVTAAAVLTWRIMEDGERFGQALWYAAFHAGAAFTNSGFSIYSTGFTRFSGDIFAQLVVVVAVIIGGLGMPVLHDLRRGSMKRWTLHTRLTLLGSAALIVLGTLGFMAFEWDNTRTLGGFDTLHKMSNALFYSVNTRSCGLNTIDNAGFGQDTMLMTYGLMFVGAGSAGTGGGIKVSTLMILLLAIWAELRGNADTTAFGRRISATVLREALALSTLAAAVLIVAIMVLRKLSDAALGDLVYEAISAFGNVGLSMGITSSLPPSAQFVIIILMYLGRVGIVTVATGFALRSHRTSYHYPEERPIVG